MSSGATTSLDHLPQQLLIMFQELEKRFYIDPVKLCHGVEGAQFWRSFPLLDIPDGNSVHIKQVAYGFLRQPALFPDRLYSGTKFLLENMITVSLHIEKLKHSVTFFYKLRVCVYILNRYNANL